MDTTRRRTTREQSGIVTDLTLTAVSDEELRRRAAEGDQRALAELTRRQIKALAEKLEAA